jgi:hypothetical protein
MNKRGQISGFIMNVAIGLAILFTGIYIVYYGIVNHDMQCSLLGQSGGISCVMSFILIGLIFIIAGIFSLYSIFRTGGPPI